MWPNDDITSLESERSCEFRAPWSSESVIGMGTFRYGRCPIVRARGLRRYLATGSRSMKIANVRSTSLDVWNVPGIAPKSSALNP
jgi:hypothetical protein